MECTLSEMSSNKWTAFHDLSQIFQLPVKTSCATNKKNPRDGALGFGGIGKCLINTALYIGEESHV